ncbi:MAG: hypothetical protein DI547_00060 [Sphingobium sp.]|nr:MAG: hypothetical protein DI547_00060 [Sphingobium sp.]
MKLRPQYVEKPWGRHDLPEWADPPANLGEPIGELWFTAPDAGPMPLLVKYLFTSERLSVQVHPDDGQGIARGLPGGKTECWYIMSAEPGATLGIGLSETLDADALRAAALDGSIETLMDWHPVHPGDFFFIPAGTVHAVGAGVSLVEIQQNVDVTYRLYDYGRPRELHLDDGTAVSRAGPYDMSLALRAADDDGGTRMLASCRQFKVMRTADARTIRDWLGDGPLWVVPIAGTAEHGGTRAQVGECLWIEGRDTVTLSEGAIVLAAVAGGSQ